jgi:hypothetical protein
MDTHDKAPEGKCRCPGLRAGSRIYLAILVPHRDCRRLLRSLSEGLFASGLWGAWSFPHAAPLALLSSPLEKDELAELARNLRRCSLEEDRKGMIVSGAEKIVPLDTPEGFPGLKLYGPALELRVEREDFGRAGEKIMALYPPILGCAVLGEGETPVFPGIETQGFRFRAAAAANMLFRPLPAGASPYSFSWKIGKLHWLPPCRTGPRLLGEEG